MASLSLALLGAFQAQYDGQDVQGFRSDKVQALLIYLATERNSTHPRERLMTMLWPGMPEGSARHNLRQVLYHLRRAFPELPSKPQGTSPEEDNSVPLLISDRRTIRLNPLGDVEVDVDRFEHLIDRAQAHDHPDSAACLVCRDALEEAVALYRGDFLEDFYLEDSNQFEDWAEANRENFRRKALDALESLATIYMRKEAYDKAHTYAMRQLEIDKLRESAHRQLMAILARSGRRVEALSQYESCRQILQDELGVEPSAETKSLYEAIRRGEVGAGKKAGTLDLLPGPISDLPPFLEDLETAEVDPGPVVARERQLAQLDQHLKKALDGHGRVVFITGEVGQGKTTLLNEFTRRALATDPKLIVAGGNCDAYAGIGDPYHPFREVLGLLGGDVESRLAAGVIGREQAERLWRLMPETAQALVQEGPDLVDLFINGAALVDRLDTGRTVQLAWLRQLSDLVGAKAPHSAKMEQGYLFKQYARVLQDLARDRPLLITLDDLQWADTGSISLLFHLGRQLEGSRILVVGAYRPEEVALKRSLTTSPGNVEQHPLAGVVSELKRQYGDIWLDLDDPATVEGRQFVVTYLNTLPNLCDEAFREALFQRTQGHALFTVELLRAMQERGDLRQNEQGRWHVSEAIDWTTLPVKVEGVIERRIERLAEDAQTILTIASIEGETFTAEVVAQVQQLDQRALVQMLSRDLDKRHRLVRAQALEWLEPGRQRLSIYRFRHQLFQQYLYQRLDEVERGYLHEAVGNVLELLYEDQTERVAGQLARHFELAGLASKAIKYLQEAGEAAADAYANTEAVAHYTRAVELAERAKVGNAELAHLYRRLGGLLLITKGDGAPEVGQAYGHAYERYQQLGESPQLFAALRGLAMFNKMRGELETALMQTEQLVLLAHKLQNPVLIVESSFALGSLLFFLGEHGQAQEHLEEGIKSYDRQQHQPLALFYDQDPGVANLSYAAWNLWLLGYPDRALERCSEALALAQALSHPYSQAMALNWTSWVHLCRRESNKVREWAEAEISLSEKHGFPLFVALGTLHKGWARAEQGEVEEGIILMQEGLTAVAIARGSEVAQPELWALLVGAYIKSERIDEGIHVLADALTMVKDNEERLLEPELYRLKGELLLLRGQPDAKIEVNFQQAIEIARRQEARSLELRAATSMARFWVSQGKQEEARQMLAPIYGWFSEGFGTLDLIEAKALLDELS